MQSNDSRIGSARFDGFEVDFRSRELRKNGIRIKLQHQPFQILKALLEKPGEIVTREELQRRIWPADTFVDFNHGLNNAVKRLREALNDTAETPRFIETLPKRGYRFLDSLDVRQTSTIDSIAVLPLENLSGDPEQEYFADGLTEALITRLAKISALRVVSRTTSMIYKGVRRPLREIARELQVDAIVEGTVARVGNHVRISAKLVNAQTDLHLWAESYDRDLRDVLPLQSEVARSIAREIQIKTTPQEQAHLAKARPVDPAAYEAYLKGRHYWNRRNGESLKKAIECFQQAIDRDPTYAAAYVGLADCAGVSGWWGLVPPDEGSAKSKVTALKALEIEETAEAHASMGWAHMYCDWDFASSEKEFQRAIELNPRYATAHQWYGHCLGCLRRFDDAFAEIELALELDPLSLIVRASYAGMLWCANRCEEAIEQSEKILDLDPTFLGGHWSLGVAYKGSRQFQKAIDEFTKGVQLSGGSAFFIAELGHAYAIAGERSGALEILQQLQDLSSHRYINGCWIAQIYAGLRDYDAAFDWLDKGFSQRSESMAHLQLFPVLYELHSDPRFNTLLRRMKFPVG